MHHHLEIVMPPTDDIEAAISAILKPFDEQGTDEDGDINRHGFWDWYVIGGRFAGSKLQSKLDPDKLEKFNAELSARHVTVSGITAGKQELKPADQIPMVDELWQEYFPETTGPCPMFAHSNDQYKSDSLLPDDVVRFADVVPTLKCSRVIFAGPNWKGEGVHANEMFSDSIWNGLTWENTAWDETFGQAVELHTKKTAGCKDEYRDLITPQDDWLVITVDYHS